MTSPRLGIKLCMILVVALGLPATVTLLYLVPPGVGDFLPPCVFHLLTGLHCPGCGATRRTHSLLHGELSQALAYNSLFVIALPLIAYATIQLGRRLWTGQAPGGWRFPAWTYRLFPWVLIAYWILRNLNFAPFNLLAPHVLE